MYSIIRAQTTPRIKKSCYTLFMCTFLTIYTTDNNSGINMRFESPHLESAIREQGELFNSSLTQGVNELHYVAETFNPQVMLFGLCGLACVCGGVSSLKSDKKQQQAIGVGLTVAGILITLYSRCMINWVNSAS